MNRLNIIGLSLIALIITGTFLIINFQAYATGCYDSNNFIFNWFTLNTVLACLDAGTGGESNTASCDSYLNGFCLFAQKSGVDLQFKKLLSANGLLTITSNSSNVIFTNNVSGESTVCGNAGAGTTIHISLTNCNAKSLLSGTGITISSNSTVITITNNKPEQGCTSAGGTTLIKTGTTCDFKGLTAGTGITVTSGTNDNTIASQCANTGTGEPICESSNNINSLIATSPLTVTDTTGDLTIACSTCVTGTTIQQLAQQSLSSSSSILNQNLGTATFTSLNNVNSGDSEHITASGALVGSIVNSMTLGLKKQNSPTGTATIAVLDSSNNIVYTFGTLDVSTLTTSMAQYTFVNTDSDYTVASGDYLGIKYSGGTATATVDVARTTNNQYDGSNSVHSVFSAGAWSDGTTDLGNSSASQNWKVDHFLTSKTFTAKKHIFFTIESRTATSTLQAGIVFNSDTGVSYSYTFASGGGADNAGVSQLFCKPNGNNNIASGDRFLTNGWIDNQSEDRKLVVGSLVSGADSSAGTTPVRAEYACKWANTSSQITSMGIIVFSGTGDFISNSILTIWGYD